MKAEEIRGSIVCEESQAVTMAFRNLGLNFESCDLKDCSGGFPQYHNKEDAFEHLQRKFLKLNFIGAHPVCKYLANSGIKHLTRRNPTPGFEWSEKYQIYMNMDRYNKMILAAHFFKSILNYVKTVGYGYVENPIIHPYALEIIGEKPTQIIQPWHFGHTQMKATCLWIVGLPKLTPSNIVGPPPKDKKERLKWQDCWLASPGPERDTIRSKTFPGIAKAMAKQYGAFLLSECNLENWDYEKYKYLTE